MPTLLQIAQSYSNPDSVNYRLAYLREQVELDKLKLGDLAFSDQVQLAMLGETVQIGGYLRTELIAAKSIFAQHLNVDSLSAISSDLGDITGGTLDIGDGNFKVSSAGKLEATGADITGDITSSNVTVTGGTITGTTIRTGSGNDRIELSGNLLRAYSGGIRRVQLDYDSLDFYTSGNALGGQIIGNNVVGLPGLNIKSSKGALLLETVNTSTRYAEMWMSANVEDGSGADIEWHAQYNNSTYGSIGIHAGGIDLDTSGAVNVYGGFAVSGSKAAMVDTETYGRRLMYALETPDVRFATYMEMVLDEGKHFIGIDPMFRETIEDYFVIPHSQNMARVSVVSKHDDGFIVFVKDEIAAVVFEVNGIRKGYKDVYMELVDKKEDNYGSRRKSSGAETTTADSGSEPENSGA